MSQASPKEGIRTWAGFTEQNNTNKKHGNNLDHQRQKRRTFQARENPGKTKQGSFVWERVDRADVFG